MDRSEAISKVVVESVIDGARAVFNVDQSKSQADFELWFENGESVPLEVTRSTDPNYIVTAHRLDAQDYFVSRKRCRRDWHIYPLDGGKLDVKRIAEHADAYVSEIEADGLDHFSYHTDANRYPSVLAILEDLRIEGGDVTKWKQPGIAIGLPCRGGLVDPIAAAVAVQIEAEKEDNIKKASPGGQLCVVIERANFLAWMGIVDARRVPSPPLQLASGFAAVWAIAAHRACDQYAVWRLKRLGAWKDLGPITVLESDIERLTQ